MAKFYLYGTTKCDYCKKAIDILSKKGHKVAIYYIDQDKGKLQEFRKRLPDATTVPQIFMQHQTGLKDSPVDHIGGYDQLLAFLQYSGDIHGGEHKTIASGSDWK